MSRSALLLDRDGTLIRDVGYPRDPDAVELLPGVARALGEARELGFRLVIVSNQSGVARGLIRPEEASAVQARVTELFARERVSFDGVYFCFHGPDEACPCRKPAPGMLHQAASDLSLELASSVMVGDKASDVEAGRAAGCSSIAFGEVAFPGAEKALASWPAITEWLRRRS